MAERVGLGGELLDGTVAELGGRRRDRGTDTHPAPLTLLLLLGAGSEAAAPEGPQVSRAGIGVVLGAVPGRAWGTRAA